MQQKDIGAKCNPEMMDMLQVCVGDSGEFMYLSEYMRMRGGQGHSFWSEIRACILISCVNMS
jgi:hypothetical protein